MSDPREKLIDLIDEFSNCMLVTQTDSGLAARPMSIANLDEGDGSMSFATSLDTDKVDEIKARSTVAVTLQSSSMYVSLSGEASVSNDRARIRELYKPAWKIWFPDGPEQSDIRLIHFNPAQGEYWDMSGAEGLRFLWEAGKAIVSGESLASASSEDQEQHAKTRV